MMTPTTDEYKLDSQRSSSNIPPLAASQRMGDRVEFESSHHSRSHYNTTAPLTKLPVVHMNLYLFQENRKYIKHCDVDGLKGSNWLTLVKDPFSTETSLNEWVWMGSFWTRLPRVCSAFANLIAQVQKTREKHGLSTKWPIHIIDWCDEGSILLRCEQVERVMGKDYISYHKRSMVVGRHWNRTTQSIDVGRWKTWTDWSTYSAAPVQHIPIPVRSDFVHAMETYARDELHLPFTSQNELTDALVHHLHRPFDVVHFWPEPTDVATGKVDNRKRAQLRNAVSRALKELHNSHPNILAHAGLKGLAKDQGREQVQTEYLSTMLQYKIVVVAQKDEWEDHYRLFEALLSGALVMSDVMLSLPTGLQDGLVFYQNMDELKDKIIYYLQNTMERRNIAKHGRQVALTMHRSWHWVERVLLGKAMTTSR